MRWDKNIQILLLLIVATTFEVSGDALVRKCIYQYIGTYRIVFGIIGVILLFGYGFTLNLAPVEFGKIVGLYIATLFVIWQTINFIVFKTSPPLSIIIGGALIVIG